MFYSSTNLALIQCLISGEKIGLEYLFQQNNRELQALTLDPENVASGMVEPEPGTINMDDEAEDEGFDESEVEDPTLPPVERDQHVPDPAATPLRRPPPPVPMDTPPRPEATPPRPRPPPSELSDSQESQSEQEDAAVSVTFYFNSVLLNIKVLVSWYPCVYALFFQDAVGPDNIEGYHLVEQLSDYLYSLKDQEPPLTKDQASHVIRLWEMLLDFDKQATTPNPRYRTRITKSSASTYKKKSPQSVVPGVDTVNR